jgi:hypothetical protein
MEIQKNKRTGGYYATIQKDDQYYCADLSYTLDHGPEVMIFPADENGEVTSYLEVYVDWPGEVTEEALKKAIASFLAE